MLQKIARFIINIFKFHKKKILVIIASAIIFALWLFPYEDISDLVTEKIAQASQNQVFVTFEKLSLSFLPVLGLEMQEVKLELQDLPAIEVKALSIYPSLLSLLKMKPGFVANMEDFMKGNVQLTLKPGVSENENVNMQNIDLEVENLDLAQLKNFIRIPLEIRGIASFVITADIDPKMNEQPDGELSLTASQLTLPSTSVPTQFGELPLPEMSFANWLMKGRLVGGDLIIEQLELGSKSDPLSVRMKGRMGLKFMPMPNGGIAPQPGAYDLKLEINSKTAENKDLKLFLGFLDKYKTSTAEHDIYALRIKSINFRANPDMSKLNKFD